MKRKMKPSPNKTTSCMGEFGRWLTDCVTTIPQYDRPATGSSEQDRTRKQVKEVKVFASTNSPFRDSTGNTHYRFRATSQVYHAFMPRTPGMIILEYDFVHYREDGEFNRNEYIRKQLTAIGQSAQANSKRYPNPLELNVELHDPNCLVIRGLEDKKYHQ